MKAKEIAPTKTMISKTYCIFSTFYLPNYSGVEKYTSNLASALVRAGQKVIVVTSALSDNAGITDEEGVTVVRIPSFFLVNKRFAVPRKSKKFEELMSWLRGQPIDYVLVNQRFYPVSILGLKFAEQQRLPAITLDHGSAHLTMSSSLIDPFIEAYEHAITKVGKKHPSRYYAVSNRSAEWLGHFGIYASGVLNNAIDAEAFCRQSSARDFRNELGLGVDDFLVVLTGRLMREKGVLIACEAVMGLVREGKGDIHLLLAGDGPLEGAIKAMDTEHIHLLGRLSSEDVSALLSQCQVLCLPTVSEGFSTSMLEAAAYGLGIIVTDTGGAEELLPNDDFGIVISDDRVDVVKDALLRFYSDRTYLDVCGKNVSARVRKYFSWENTARCLIEAFAH